MNPDTWKRAEEIFEAGLGANAEEREHLLASAPPDVAVFVRGLWRQHAEAGSFLEQPVASLELPLQFAEGRILGGRFKVIGFIGAGGMGEVYRAHDEHLGRTVAIKALRAHMTADTESRSRFEREARAICSLNHPYICALYDVIFEGAIPLLVMEYIKGETLADRLARGQMTLAELVAAAEGVADALAQAHRQGVIHRDLKPGNIMLTEHGPKLLDFGVAKRVIATGAGADGGSTVTQTAAGAIVGSAAYMSPEQAQGRPTDHRSDVFSFGAVLYEMATGRRAFQGETHLSTLAAVLEREPEPIRTLAPASPPKLDRIVRRCLRKDRAERFADMAEVRAALQVLTKPPAAPWRHLTLTAPAAVVTVAIIAALAWRSPQIPADVKLPKPKQLTADLGISCDPSLSPDGQWLAYTSDRGSPGKVGLWLQRLDGTDARKLTECSYDLESLNFTPDGRRIVYSCAETRSGIDVYSIAVTGGDPSLIAKDGEWSTISPDGKYIAVLGKSGKYAVLPLAGGSRVTLRPDEHFGMNKAVWSPDSQRLLFFSGMVGWIAPRDGREAVRVALSNTWYDAGKLQYIGPLANPTPFAWTATDLYVAYRSPGSRDVWRVPFDSARGIATGEPVQITTGLSAYSGVVQHGKVLFDVMNVQSNLFAFRLSNDGRKLAAEPRQLTFQSSQIDYPRVSRDGRKASYVSLRGDEPELFVIDVASGVSSFIAKLPSVQSPPPISHNGKEVAWSEGRDVYRSPTSIPTRELVCRDCGAPSGWLPDGSGLFLEDRKERDKIYVLDFSTGQRKVVLTKAGLRAYFGGLSSDGGWLTIRLSQGEQSHCFIARLNPRGNDHKPQWIPLEAGLSSCEWSTTGDLMYAADGKRILAIPLNGPSKYPIGPPFPLFELPKGIEQKVYLLGAGDGVIVAVVMSAQQNIWIQDLPK